MIYFFDIDFGIESGVTSGIGIYMQCDIASDTNISTNNDTTRFYRDYRYCEHERGRRKNRFGNKPGSRKSQVKESALD